MKNKIFVLLILFILIAEILLIYTGWGGYAIYYDSINFYIRIGTYFNTLSLLLILLFKYKEIFLEIRNSKISKRIIFLTLLCSLYFIYENMFISYLLYGKFINPDSYKQIFDNLYLFLFSIIIIPINEEIFYRKILLGYFIDKKYNVLGVIITALMFTYPHCSLTVLNNILLFIAGVVLALLYIKTRNILTCIIAHSINNIAANLIFIIGSKGIIDLSFSNFFKFFIN